MTAPPLNASAEQRSERLFLGAIVALLVICAAILAPNVSRSAGGSDSSGYLNAARFLAEGRTHEEIAVLRALHLPPDMAFRFLPLGFAQRQNRVEIAPSYPVGLPAHMVLFTIFLGWNLGPFVVSPLATLGSIVVMALLVRRLGFSRLLAFFAAAALAAFPTVIFQGLQPMSDVLAMFWALVALYALVRAEESTVAAFVAGVAAAVGIAVRPTSGLLLVSALAFRSNRRGLVAAVAGFTIAIVPLLWWQHLAYGSMLRTGYGSIGSLLAWENVPVRFRHYLYWLGRIGSPLMIAGVLYLPFARMITLRVRVAAFAAFLLTFAFYCFYQPYETWWYTRFLLPVLPVMIIGEVALLAAFGARFRGRMEKAAVVALMIIQVTIGVKFSESRTVLHMDEEEARYPEAVRRMTLVAKPSDVVVAMQTSGAVKYYTGKTSFRWDLATGDEYQALRAHASIAGVRIFALLFPFEVEDMQKRLPGNWRKLSGDEELSLWLLDGG